MPIARRYAATRMAEPFEWTNGGVWKALLGFMSKLSDFYWAKKKRSS